jgi:type I restriction enzyme S subunit
MSDWPDIKINDLCLRVVSGGTPLKSVVEFYENGTIPWLKTGEIKKGLIYETEECISERGLENSSAKLIPPNSVIVAMYGDGDTAGNVAINKIDLTTNQACCNLILDAKKAHYKFIYYYLKGSYNNLVNLKLGGSQQNLNAQSIKNFPIKTPSLSVQKKIAAILSAYDDLIENNKRRISLLEKMAEEIYREWFVRMRFPGHEMAKIEKGIPEDWDRVKIGNAFSFTGGGTPSKGVDKYWTEGEINWYTPSDITSSEGIFLEHSEARCTEEGLNNSSARLFPPYSIMMTSRATIGAIGINTTPACTNQGFITCVPNERFPTFFLYHWLKLSKQHFELLSGGATFPELTKSTFKKMEIVAPTADLIARYEELVTPQFKTIENLLKTNKRAVKTRDLLLPRLISGKFPVKDLNIRFPPSMSAEVEGPAAVDLKEDAAHAQLHLRRRHRAGDT